MICYDDILCFVMAGGRGTRLKVLTRDTCKPMVDIFGRYRIFDFVAKNIADTGIPITLVAMQCEQKTFAKYVGNGKAWGFDGIDKKLEVVCPDAMGGFSRFAGTADSVRKSAGKIEEYSPETVLVLAADHVYSMNYSRFIAQHNENKADITIMTNPVPESKVRELGIVKIDESNRIIDFAEKPQNEEVIEGFRLSPEIKERLGIDDPDLNFLASMGNYAFFWNKLKGFLSLPGTDFGKDVIPAIKQQGGSLYAFVFNGYWRDVGRVHDYFKCNMDFTNGSSPIDLSEYQTSLDENTCGQVADDASIRHTILNSCDVVSNGSVITDSVLGQHIVVEEACALDHCVLLGTGRNGSYDSQMSGREYTTRIGGGSKLSYVILDENVWIGRGVDIGPHNGTPEKRGAVLQRAGLKPYKELANGTAEGDFYIDSETGILVIGRQDDPDPKKKILPDGLMC